MQTQSRLGVSGLQGGWAEEHEAAVVRELARGHELTARLQEAAMRALRGKGQAEATVASILGEMSRAFTLSISIMAGGSGPAAPPAPGTPRPCMSVAAAARRGRAKDDGVPRKRKMTSSPHSDGYQWRKYGQKNIMRTNFPRCYYKCSNHRGRNCPATKQVQQQQHSDGGGPLYLVIYVNEHTCHAPAADQPEAAARGAGETTPLVCFSRQGAGAAARDVVALDHGAAKEERERQALVSSLTCVLQQGLQHSSAGGPGASAATADASQLPVRLAGGDEELDITDYDVITDTVYFGASTDELDDGMLF